MQVGEQVVCVDDQFPRPLAKYYTSLPVKDRTYTVRAMFIGRGVMHPVGETAHGEIGLLLEELVNGMDPRHKHRHELGFNSSRFRPLTDSDAGADDEEELVRVRTAHKVEPLKRDAFALFTQSPTQVYMNATLTQKALQIVLNPNVLINMVSQRVRQLNSGGGGRSRPLLAEIGNLSAADIALHEIIEGKMGFDLPDVVELTRPTGKNRRRPQHWTRS